MCDIAHARWVDRIMADFQVEQQAVATAVAVASALGGAPSVPDMQTLAERLEEFETALASAPPKVDKEDAELRAALGLRSGR